MNCNCPNSSYGKKHTTACYDALAAERDEAERLLTRALDWMPASSPVRREIVERIKRGADQPDAALSAEEHCRLLCAWKGGGPCLADDCPRRAAVNGSAEQ